MGSAIRVLIILMYMSSISYGWGILPLVGGVSTAGSCGGSPQNLGYSTIGTNNGTTGQLAEVLNVYTAPCTGSLQNAYAYHQTTNSENSKVCIYLDDGDNIPNSGDTKVACSGVISSNVNGEWATAAFSGGTVTEGNVYWVVLAGGGTTQGWNGKWDSDTVSDYGRSGGNDVYTNEPATLGTYGLGPDRWYSAYVTVQ